jgi:hypothetical protein
VKKGMVTKYLGLNFEVDDLIYGLEYLDPDDFLLDKIMKSLSQLKDEVFNKIGANATTGNAPVAKTLASKGLQNANLNTGAPTQLIPIVGANSSFKKRYGAYLLYPTAAVAWKNAYNELRNAGLTVQVYSAYRDLQHQNSLGSGTGVAGVGSSPHGWGMALDISPFNQMAKPVVVNGKSRKSTPQGNIDGRKTEFYRKVGEIMAKHNWYNPWRLADNAGSVDEIWHWEYWGPA